MDNLFEIGHSFPCAIDMHRAIVVWYGSMLTRMPVARLPKGYCSGKYLSGKRFMKRSRMLGSGETLITMVLN